MSSCICCVAGCKSWADFSFCVSFVIFEINFYSQILRLILGNILSLSLFLCIFHNLRLNIVVIRFNMTEKRSRKDWELNKKLDDMVASFTAEEYNEWVRKICQNLFYLINVRGVICENVDYFQIHRASGVFLYQIFGLN